MYEEMSRNALFPEYYQPYRRHGSGMIVPQNKGFKKLRRRHGVVMVRVFKFRFFDLFVFNFFDLTISYFFNLLLDDRPLYD